MRPDRQPVKRGGCAILRGLLACREGKHCYTLIREPYRNPAMNCQIDDDTFVLFGIMTVCASFNDLFFPSALCSSNPYRFLFFPSGFIPVDTDIFILLVAQRDSGIAESLANRIYRSFQFFLFFTLSFCGFSAVSCSQEIE